jgi:hypothetical protein
VAAVARDLDVTAVPAEVVDGSDVLGTHPALQDLVTDSRKAISECFWGETGTPD